MNLFVAAAVTCVILLGIGRREIGAAVAGMLVAILGGLVLGCFLLPGWWPIFVSILAIIDIGLVLVIFGEDILIR